MHLVLYVRHLIYQITNAVQLQVQGSHLVHSLEVFNDGATGGQILPVTMQHMQHNVRYHHHQIPN